MLAGLTLSLLLAAPPPVAWLPLARQHLAAGRLDRAVQALQGARACWSTRGAACGFAQSDYDALLGAVYFTAGQPEPASAALRRALAARPDDAALWLYLAQAEQQRGRPAEAAAAYARGAPAAPDGPELALLWARAHQDAGEEQAALEVLDAGLDRDPQADRLHAQRALLLGRAQLLRPAAAAAARVQDPALRRPLHHALAAEAGADAGEAALILEQLQLLDPDDAQTAWARAQQLRARGAPGLAARLLSRLGRWAAAAEAARQAGDLPGALRANARIADPQARLNQRLDLLLAAERFAAAHALGRRLPAPTDAQRYRLAYAALRVGDPERALRLAQAVTTPALRAGAARLAEAARTCRAAPTRCP